MDQALPDNPLDLFTEWFEKAKEEEPNDPDAMCLATCDSNGRPDARMVLLKGYGESGFWFFTNADSQKGMEIKENPRGSLCFYWKSIRKQVRLRGKIEMLDDQEADEYFASRPRGAQIGAWASQQSRELESAEALQEAVAEHEAKFEGQDIPRPAYWKGYRLAPEKIEFWISRPNRLHDRFEYRKDEAGNWSTRRLYP